MNKLHLRLGRSLAASAICLGFAACGGGEDEVVPLNETQSGQSSEERRLQNQVDRLEARDRERARDVARERQRLRAAKRKRAAESTRNSGPSAQAGSFAMPNVVGMNLQAAQDGLQSAAGNPLFFSESEDATGAGRSQILDRGWQVCGQNIPAGEAVGATANVVLSVVRVSEGCP